MSIVKSLFIGSSLATLALAIPAYAQVSDTAQEGQSNEDAQRVEEPDARRLTAVVVTAQKRA